MRSRERSRANGEVQTILPTGILKEEAVRLVHASDEKRPIPKIARDLGVSPETLRKWVKIAPR